MNETLKEKLFRKIERLPEEAARQLLDYVEFLESKHNRSRRKASPFERLSENIEGTFSGDRLADAAAKGTADLAEAAGKIMGGLAAAARAAAEEFQAAARKAAASSPPSPAGAAGAEDEGGEAGTAEAAGEAGAAQPESGDDGGQASPA